MSRTLNNATDTAYASASAAVNTGVTSLVMTIIADAVNTGDNHNCKTSSLLSCQVPRTPNTATVFQESENLINKM